MPADRWLTRAGRALHRAVTLRCPRCGQTKLFRTWFSMHEICDLCGLRFERAQGYFVGAIYVNYAMTTVIALTGYFVLWRVADPPTAVQLALWVPFVALFPLWFFRYSRSIWLALEYFVNPEE
jgi:uncharacterized protein (DUF983 family)